MSTLLIAILLQASPAVPPVPDRFSILVPVSREPCVRKPAPDEIVVCADPLPDQALPLPREAVSPDPVASNPELSGTGALAAADTPCAARNGGCQVGVGTPILPLVHGAVDLLKRAMAKTPDKSRRVPIPLD